MAHKVIDVYEGKLDYLDTMAQGEHWILDDEDLDIDNILNTYIGKKIKLTIEEVKE